jgi:BioD-like phosphotransacetylase family protein
VRPLYIVGTRRDVGKTTFCIGLIHALRERELSVGYTKPLGQRVSTLAGRPVHDDALVVSEAMGMAAGSATMAVPLTRGRVEKEIQNLRTDELAEKVTTICEKLRANHDVVIIEGMGHVAMGSCLHLSAPDVANLVGAKTLLISGGGIGRAIDAISLCATFISAHDAEMIGVVVNKVYPEKFDRVRNATTKGLGNLGIRSLGTVPYEEVLASPTVRQVAEQLNGEILCGTDEALSARVANTVVAAMEPHHMVPYLKDRALVITPGDRSDNILAILSTHILERNSNPTTGVVLTGGFRPAGKVMSLLDGSGLPAVLCQEDTYTIAARLREMVFKIRPDDEERIDAAKSVVNQYIDVDGILESLRE